MKKKEKKIHANLNPKKMNSIYLFDDNENIRICEQIQNIIE
jgi:hypothetical protein